MAQKKTGSKVVDFATDFKGKWFDPLVQGQKIEGVFIRSFDTESDFKNLREKSENFGKKKKTNYEIKLNKGGQINFSEGSGPLQALLDALEPGDRVIIHYDTLELPDNGGKMPKTVKTKEQMWKWRGGKKEASYPRFELLRIVKK